MSIDRKFRNQERLHNKFMEAVRKDKPLKKVIKHYRRYEAFVDFCKEKCFNYHHHLEEEVQETYQKYKEKLISKNN
jgi:hypothetical protein